MNKELYEDLVKQRFGHPSVKALLFNLNYDKDKSYDELSRQTGMSLPLICYYINGNKKTKGLYELGIINKTFNLKQVFRGVTLTKLGLEVRRLI